MRIDATVLEDLARGCAVLGAGGGGDTYAGVLACRHAIALHGPVPVVDLDDLDDDAVVLPVGGIGAPTVSIEKVGNVVADGNLVRTYERVSGRRVGALMGSEIGGGNGLVAVMMAARLGLPVADADGMGRAFPEIPQVTMELAGVSPAPAVLADERGNVVVSWPADGAFAERIARVLSIEFGGDVLGTDYAMPASVARTATVRGSVSLAIRIGRALRSEDDPVGALLAAVAGRRLLGGKLVDVDRVVEDGFVRGAAGIEGLGDDRGRTLRVSIQNENLLATEDGRVRASTPDIITVLDTGTGAAVPTERLRYGQRVDVVAFACDPVWRTPAGLALAGPRHFGYDVDYVPFEALT
jgi:DUF917 family protein